jgi:hypothetical protein
MKYYKYLDLDFKPVAVKLKDYIDKHSELFLVNQKTSSWKSIDLDDVLKEIPELLVMLAPLNLTIKYAAFFVSDYPIGTLHMDHDIHSSCRIIMPVLNCENTETRFFVTTGEPIKVLQPNGIPLLKLDPATCTRVDQYYLDRALVFRNNCPHQVVSNNPSTPRISFTMGFVENIEYLLD